MISTVLQFIEHVLIPLGGWGVFLASCLEEVIAPIPSALVITLSGFLFLHGSISVSFITTLFFTVVIPASLGVTIGSLFVHGIAFYAGKPVLEKWGKWIGLSWADIETLQKKFDTKAVDEIALFSLRALPIVPSVAISAWYGLIRFSVKKYILFTFLGTCVRALILALVGWQVGGLYRTYGEIISRFENSVLVILLLAGLAFVFYKIRKKKAL